jgi:hypothetical protein
LSFLKSLFSTAAQDTQPLNPRLRDGYNEATKIAETIVKEKWRSTQPKPIEIALGYAAFYYWLVGGESLSQCPNHYEYPSDWTRMIAAMIITRVSENPAAVSLVRKQKPEFDGAKELALFPHKLPREHPVWGESTSRFTVMLCRDISCAATGMIGNLQFIDPEDPTSSLELGRELLQSAGG